MTACVSWLGALHEADLTVEKRCHGDFISRIARGHSCAPTSHGFPRQTEAGETLLIGSLEVQAGDCHQIQWRHSSIDTIGPCKAIGNWGPHIWIAHLRQHRAIQVLDHRVDNTLGMNHHLHSLRLQVKNPTRFNKFQALVHQGRRINRNLAPHGPIGMSTRLVRCGLSHLLITPAAKGSARGRQQHFTDTLVAWCRLIVDRQTLKNCIVLTVNGQQSGPRFTHRLHQQMPSHYQRFFVCQ